jgi:type IV pilus assembly protein PilB
MAKKRGRMGDLLLEDGIITPLQLEEALSEQKRTGEFLGQVLVRRGWVTETVICECLHRQLGLPVLHLEGMDIADHVLTLVSERLATRYLAMPVQVEGQHEGRPSALKVAMADPLNPTAIEDLRFYSGYFIRPVLAPASEIGEAINKYYRLDTSMNEVLDKIVSDEEVAEVTRIDGPPEPEPVDELIKESQGRPIVRLTNWILTKAVNERASDIHVEPQERELVLRYRIDGMLHEVERFPKWVQGPLVSRIKVLSNLDIAEKRQPQDGHFKVEIAQRPIELRVSTLPVTHGEKVVARIVDQYRTPADLYTLGLQEKDLERIQHFIARPQGIVLVTGPTGSGKSTTLYSFLRALYSEHSNIVTVEDPVEYQLPRINQVQVDEKAKKTFAAALRAILRQDPDVIMIGEIRDAETAQIAFRASITGHLVLSTVHTNDAPSAVTRLIDIGLQPFMVASSLLAVMSMRLVRTICPKCREPYPLDNEHARSLGMHVKEDEPIMVYRGAGCSQCRNTGYYGRTGLFEIIEVNEDIRELINQGAPDSTIRIAAIDLGMRTLAEDGIEKMLAGITTLDEINRVVYVAEENRRLCPFCSTVLAGEFDYCTACGHFVGDSCVQCHRRLNSHWSYCPFCGTTNRAHRLEARSAMMTVRRERMLAEVRAGSSPPEAEKAEEAEKDTAETNEEATEKETTEEEAAENPDETTSGETPASTEAENAGETESQTTTAIDKVRRVAAAALGQELPDKKKEPPAAA